MITERIKKPWIALSLLEVKVNEARNNSKQQITLDIELADDIIVYYQQAQRAAEYVSTLSVACQHEHVC